MSFLIKGRKMQRSCSECIISAKACELWKDFDNRITERPEDCPLVEVPDNHSRLIDADEFLHRAIGTKCFRGDFALMLQELVSESTTIIQSDDGR